MHPPSRTFDVAASLILMAHVHCAEGFFDALFSWPHVFRTAHNHVFEGASCHAYSNEILHRLTRSLRGQQWLLGQRDSHCSNGRSVLHWRDSCIGEGRLGESLTMWAIFLLSLIL